MDLRPGWGGRLPRNRRLRGSHRAGRDHGDRGRSDRRAGEIDLLPLIGIVWLCCVLGDTASFFLGRRQGREFMVRHGPKVKVGPERLRKVESYFDRHGGKTILIGRFIGLVRAVSPFVAGASGLRFGRFVPFSIIGCGLWADALLGPGISLLPVVRSGDGRGGAGHSGLWHHDRRGRRRGPDLSPAAEEEERRRLAAWAQRQADRPLVRPIGAVIAPVWRRVVRPAAAALVPPLRFVRQRLTPGAFGLELTTAVAVAGVGLYIFALYAWLLAGGTRVTRADRKSLEIADDLFSDTGVSVAKVVTDLGAFTTVATLLVGVGILLAVRRRYAELAVLVTGAVLIFVSVQLAKNGIDRPRPAAPLDDAEGQSFPSGHAAYSTIWVGVAVMVARVLPGLARDAVLIAIALAISAVVGLSRIYLRVHYWSDVVGGWALGAGFARPVRRRCPCRRVHEAE